MNQALALILVLCIPVGCTRPNNVTPKLVERPSTKLVETKTQVIRSMELHDFDNMALIADRLAVTALTRNGQQVLYESGKRADIEAFAAALDIERPSRSVHCGCRGYPKISLYRDGELLCWVSNKHGKRVSSPYWDTNMLIVDNEKWLQWFDERGMPELRQEVEDAISESEKRERSMERGISEMPESLAQAWRESQEIWGAARKKKFLVSALDESLPDRKDQIWALLNLYGAGADAWNSSHNYETVVEKLLLQYEPNEVVASIARELDSESHLLGAARFLSGRLFSHEWPNGLQDLPEGMRESLWNQVKDSSHSVNVNRAEKAFQ